MQNKNNTTSQGSENKIGSVLPPTAYYLSPHTHRLPPTAYSKGFTLIETFVAVTILVTAVAGPLTIASKGLQSAVLAKDQLTASFLAQEGLEYVREVRDNNCLQYGCTDLSTGDPIPNVWLTGLDLCRTDAGYSHPACTVDATEKRSPAIETCSGACVALRYNNTTSFYTYDPNDPLTTFVRSIAITPLNDHEATVTSTVSWRTGPYSRQIVVSEIISDWQ